MATRILAPVGAPTHPQSAVDAQRPAYPADFAAWLQARQQASLYAMRSTTGDEFTKHSSAFLDLTTAIRVLWNFEVEVSHG